MESDKDIVTKLSWEKITPVTLKEEGVYFLRTSLKEIDEKKFWLICNTIREIEASFRVLKADLRMRPGTPIVRFQYDGTPESGSYRLSIGEYNSAPVESKRLPSQLVQHCQDHEQPESGFSHYAGQEGRKILFRKCS